MAQTGSNGDDTDHGTGIRLIAPLVFLVVFVMAGAVAWFAPFHVGLPALVRWIAGGILIVAPLASVPRLFALFHAKGNEFDVRKLPSGLVTEGAYRYSRNPGYLGLVVVGIGIAVLFDSPWFLLADLVAAGIIQQQIIVKEEAVLERTFGEEYRRYKAKVRRWL